VSKNSKAVDGGDRKSAALISPEDQWDFRLLAEGERLGLIAPDERRKSRRALTALVRQRMSSR
jgi:hypothetical protein